MDIKEALTQVKKLNSTLEAFKTIDEFLATVISAKESFEQDLKEKADLDKAIAEKNSELSALTIKYNNLSIQLHEKYEMARDAAQESLKTLKENFNKEMEEAKTSSHSKITELTEKVSGLKVEVKNLDREIKDKQATLDDLNKSIESIRAKLN